MYDLSKFYIDGTWVEARSRRELDVINPATEEVIGKVALGTPEDVDAAVAAARRAFETYSQTSREERLALLGSILTAYQARFADVCTAISDEMGAPMKLCNQAQAAVGLAHTMTMLKILETFEFEEDIGTTRLLKEPAGVIGMITPWNWPVNQIICKVIPALAAGCTMVLKPSEIAPVSASLLAEVLHAAGVPKGVFNMVHGDGPGVGEAIARHPGIDVVSFTGSTRAGVQVAKLAADSVKRVAQELGGKSANIILEGADITKAVTGGVMQMMMNSGQSCNAPSRMLVPAARYEQAVQIAKGVAEKIVVGDPKAETTTMGPLANKTQYEKVLKLISRGVEEGATVVTGGAGRPQGLDKGYYVRPTIFANVRNEMTIAREEIFGPVLVMIPYETEEEAVRIANDTPYGLSGYVFGGSVEHARRVAARLRTGMVHVNGASVDFAAPFGGYRQSGNGREWGAKGLEEFLETKAVMGYSPA
ncbi:MAG: aldehyde dehydrogenase family protein [Polyangiaceae bacterium]|nr:aldehyde dehydrogenase family protein [Polyangiaceae bacterium]